MGVGAGVRWAGRGGGGPLLSVDALPNDGTGGSGGVASGDATAAGAKMAVNPPSRFGSVGAGAAGATVLLGLVGTAEMTNVFASLGIALSRIHVGRSVNVVRKRVTTVVIPSTS